MAVYTAAQWQDIGPAEITWNSVVLGKTVANVDGGTHGGVQVMINTESRKSFRDAEGTGAHDETIVGLNVSVKALLTGLSLEQLTELIPGAELSGTTQRALFLKTPVGTSKRANSQALIIKPIIAGTVSTDNHTWVQAPHAYPEPNIELAFDLENQKVYEITFTCFFKLTEELEIAQVGHST